MEPLAENKDWNSQRFEEFFSKMATNLKSQAGKAKQTCAEESLQVCKGEPTGGLKPPQPARVRWAQRVEGKPNKDRKQRGGVRAHDHPECKHGHMGTKSKHNKNMFPQQPSY